MALFFSRRTYNATKKAFTNNAAEKTRYVTMSDTTPRRGSNLSQADWLDLVRAEGGNTEILIYVHGFNTSQNDMLDRMAKIKAGVKAQGFNGAVIAYDWPSNGSVLVVGIVAFISESRIISIAMDVGKIYLCCPDDCSAHGFCTDASAARTRYRFK